MPKTITRRSEQRLKSFKQAAKPLESGWAGRVRYELRTPRLSGIPPKVFGGSLSPAYTTAIAFRLSEIPPTVVGGSLRSCLDAEASSFFRIGHKSACYRSARLGS